MTNSSSDRSDSRASDVSAAASNSTTMSSQPRKQSYQLLVFLAQSPTEDSSLYGRLGGSSAAGHAEHTVARAHSEFRGGPA